MHIVAMPLSYILITPARNEADLIDATVRAVVAQTYRPKKWLIISDGSTDDTDRIVEHYAAAHPWIELMRLPVHRDRSFAAKAGVVNAGYERMHVIEFDVVGNLDADITFEPDYFELLVAKFEADPKLGVAGTHYVEGEFHSYHDSYMNIEHVNGGCQMFRRGVFEAIGGYRPIRGGGIDWVAVTTARMLGWKTHSFADRVFYHHRKIGTADTNEIVARFRYGKKDYFLGGHPAWQIFRGLFQMTKRPYIVGGMATLLGYFLCILSRTPRQVSDELMRFHRDEQMTRLRNMLNTRFRHR